MCNVLQKLLTAQADLKIARIWLPKSLQNASRISRMFRSWCAQKAKGKPEACKSRNAEPGERWRGGGSCRENGGRGGGRSVYRENVSDPVCNHRLEMEPDSGIRQTSQGMKRFETLGKQMGGAMWEAVKEGSDVDFGLNNGSVNTMAWKILSSKFSYSAATGTSRPTLIDRRPYTHHNAFQPILKSN